MACGGNAKKQTENKEAAQVNKETSTTENVQMRQIGSLKVTCLKDNAGDKRMPLTLFGDVPQHLVDSLGVQQGVPSSVSTFLVETEGLRILFDTGVGAPDSQLLAGLKSAGVSPADVTHLYLTHFHGDHIGGMMKGDSVVFPKAEVYVSKNEYDAWMAMPGSKKEQVVRTMEAYKARLHLVNFGDTLPGEFVVLEAIGHTPGHTVYQSGKLLIAGDLMHGAALQVACPDFCASYDMDAEMAIRTRKYYLQYARENKLVMAGMHLPVPAFLVFE